MYKFLDFIKEMVGSLGTTVAGSGAVWFHTEY